MHRHGRASNTTIVRERGCRPEWVPILFIPAVDLEAIFFERANTIIMG
jgi:hypothetical protein